MIARFTRWVDRQFATVDYQPVNTGVMFVCFLPFTIALLALDSLPQPLAPVALIVTGLIGVSAALWAFWRWFKGAGDSRRSDRLAKYSRSYGLDNDG